MLAVDAVRLIASPSVRRSDPFPAMSIDNVLPTLSQCTCAGNLISRVVGQMAIGPHQPTTCHEYCIVSWQLSVPSSTN